MAWFRKKAKVFVLGLDGVPYSFLKKETDHGNLPHLAEMFQQGTLRRMHSVYPTVSSVAWTTYATGENPAGHNIFGFVDRIPDPFTIRIPTARDRKAQTLWQNLSQAGRRVIVINVPLTYPPEPVNGILVSGFLCTDINKSSYPPDFSNHLKSKAYVIDVDAWLARKSKGEFMDKLHQAMEKRFEIAFALMEEEKWDFFQLHIMETDRLFHFFWEDLETRGEYDPQIESFFDKLDGFIGQVEQRLSGKDGFLILSDHGFCGIKAEVQLNVWLEKEGLLRFEEGADKKLEHYHRDSMCYSLIPGRIFINLEGREEKGTVKPGDYEKVREEIKGRLLGFRDPGNHGKIIDRIFFREEIYQGPYMENAPDMVAHPVRGYDLKARVGGHDIFERSALKGMHTYDDAFICGVNLDASSVTSIQDVRGSGLRL